MPDHDNDSPFESPPLTEGYPLDKKERSELKRAIEELDRTNAPRSPDPAERPAAATA